MIETRIVDYYVVDAEDENMKEKIGINIKLQIFDPEVIISETCLPEKKHRVAGELLYYEERISFAEGFEN